MKPLTTCLRRRSSSSCYTTSHHSLIHPLLLPDVFTSNWMIPPFSPLPPASPFSLGKSRNCGPLVFFAHTWPHRIRAPYAQALCALPHQDHLPISGLFPPARGGDRAALRRCGAWPKRVRRFFSFWKIKIYKIVFKEKH